MSLFLKQRAAHLSEWMDHPECDKRKLFNTYSQFYHVNNLISRWKTLFDHYISPLALRRNREGKKLRILDIGCGGGDICLKLSKWSGHNRHGVEITGIDPDPRAIEYTTTLELPVNVVFRRMDSGNLVKTGERYDVVITNHLVHHLKKKQFLQLCRDAEKLADDLILFNDIRRSEIGFGAFGMIAPLFFRSSFIYRDGLISILRSFRYRELKMIAPNKWQVKKLFPFRLLLVCKISEGV